MNSVRTVFVRRDLVASAVDLHEREPARAPVLACNLAGNLPLLPRRALILFGETSLQPLSNSLEALVVADVVR
jgi:hypothetical protein